MAPWLKAARCRPVGPVRLQVLGCTNRAGITRSNTEASLTVPGLGTMNGVSTKVWTDQDGGVVSSYSRHSILGLTLVDSPLGSLEVAGITSQSRTYHTPTGFQRSTSTEVESITLTPPVGAPQSFPVPMPGLPVVIPGVATIAVGDSAGTAGASGARAWADAVNITVVATGTRARIAHSAAQISGGIVSGLYGGSSNATRATGLAGTLKSGPTPLNLMPCQGTNGLVTTKNIARLDLTADIVARGLTASQSGSQNGTLSSGYEYSRVDSFDLAGRLIVRRAVGRAAVTRTAAGVAKNTNGTSTGDIMVDGETRTIPESGVLETPGLARLEDHLVTRTADGISVTALRITLLDGSLAVINLGQATLRIRPSGL